MTISFQYYAFDETLVYNFVSFVCHQGIKCKSLGLSYVKIKFASSTKCSQFNDWIIHQVVYREKILRYYLI